MAINVKLLGQIIKEQRGNLDINQVELAAKMGVSQAYISDLEKGKKKNPTVTTLTKLAVALRMDTEELILAVSDMEYTTIPNSSIERLHQIVDKAEVLPEEVQNEIGRAIEALINYHKKK